MQESFLPRAEELFDKAAGLPRAERASFLDASCEGDPSLRELLQRWLDALDAMGDFMEPAAPIPDDAVLEEHPPHPERIGRYDIVRVVGSGGMGIVYEARQRHPSRRVALKVIHPALVSRQWLRRFEREAEILGRLHHPSVATIYETGKANVTFPGRAPVPLPFLAMEFVEGVPLHEHAVERKLDRRQQLELFARICDAVQHAHEHGVTHRDLKPSNILVAADGQPIVLDFGIARTIGEEWKVMTLATASAQFMGTVPYMSPEQVGAEHQDVDVRSDVYALGVILYELLCGRLPIETDGRSLPEAIRAIREDEPPRLSSLDTALRGDIEAVVGKALRKEKERRYAGAGEMAADIRRHLRAEPVLARPTSTLYQLRRFARRNKVLVGGVAATIVALTLGLLAATNFARREAVQRRIAESSAERTQHALVEARLDEAVALLAIRDFDAAARSLDTVPELRRGWEWQHLRWRTQQYLAEIPSPEGGLTGIVVARRAPLLFSVSGDGMVRVLDLVTARTVKEFATGHPWTGQLAAHPEGDLLLGEVAPTRPRDPLASEGRHVAVWEVKSGQELWRRPAAPSVGSDAFSPDGTLVAIGMWDRREILLLDARTGEVRQEITVPDGIAQQPNFAPDGHRLVYHNGGSSGVVDRRTGRTVRFPGVAFPRFTGDGNVFAGVRETVPKAILVRLDTGETTGLPGTRFLAPLAGPEGRRFLVATNDGTAVQRLDAPNDVRPVGGRGSIPHAWSSDGTRLVTRRMDGGIRIWDAATDTRTLRIKTHARTSSESQSVYGNWNETVALSPDGRTLATAGWRFVTLRSLSDGSEIWNSYRLEAFPTALVFSPDGRRLAVAGREGPVTIVDAASGVTERVLSRPDGRLAGLSWARDGSTLVLATVKGEIRFLDAESGKPVGALKGPSGEIHCLARSPDGTHLAAGGRFVLVDATTGARDMLPGVVVWDVSNKDAFDFLRSETGPVAAVAFDAAERAVAAVTAAGELAVWDVGSKQRLGGAVHDVGALQSVAFAPDGKRVVTGGTDGKLHFWETRSYEHVVTLETGLFDGSFVSFSPDGSTVVGVGGDGLVLFETGPPPDGLAARTRAREARHVVNRLYNRLTFSEDVTKQLQADRDLPDDVRAEALELVRIRGDHIGWLNSDATLGYRTQELSPEDRRLVLRKIELANRLWPDRPEFVANLGKCQYRAGMYREALANVRRARDLYGETGQEPKPEDWAFLAMAHWRLDERREARETLRHVAALIAERHDETEPWNRLFYEEAASLIGTTP